MAYFDTIKLEKGMYAVAGKSFTDVLESLDPSEEYKGTALEGLDAYQRQLKRFDIKVAGNSSSTVEKFFGTIESSALFPEFVARAIKTGKTEKNLLPHIVASTTNINSLDYRSIVSNPSAEELSLKDTNEGQALESITFTPSEHHVKLIKRGKLLEASYEALKFQRLDLFAVALRQIGAYIAISQFKDAVNVLKNGDGNDNAAEVMSTQGTGITYADLIELYGSFDPYEMNTLVVSPDMLSSILTMDEFKNPEIGKNFISGGKMITPFGATVCKASNLESGTVLGLDKSCALEMVVASDVTVEYDKLIDKQLERAAISTIAGFSKIFPDASKVMKAN